MKDLIGIHRGQCFHNECKSIENQCPEYYTPASSLPQLCLYCNHFPRHHEAENVYELPNDSQQIPNIEINVPSVVNENQTQVTDKETKSTSGINHKTSKYLPKKLSIFVSPLLNGKYTSLKNGKKMENCLMNEIITHLDENKLILNITPTQAKREYFQLRSDLIKTYPQLLTNIWKGEPSNKGWPMEHTKFVQRLSSNRKMRRFLKIKEEKKRERERNFIENVKQSKKIKILQ